MSTGYIAQWLERLTADQQVPGSNPGVPSLCGVHTARSSCARSTTPTTLRVATTHWHAMRGSHTTMHTSTHALAGSWALMCVHVATLCKDLKFLIACTVGQTHFCQSHLQHSSMTNASDITCAHSSVVRAADCRSAGPWFKSGCALHGKDTCCMYLSKTPAACMCPDNLHASV